MTQPRGGRTVARLATGFVSRVVSHVSALVLLIYGARSVTPDDFGAYTLASVVVTLATLLLYAGVYEYVLKCEDLARDEGPSFAILLVIGSTAAAALLALAPTLATLYGAPSLEPILRVFAVVPLLGMLSAWREAEYLRDSTRLDRYFAITAGRDLSALAVGVALLWAGFGLWALVAYRLAVSFAGYALLWIASPRLPRLRWDPPRMRHIVRYGGGIGATRLLGFVSGNGIDLIIGLFLTPAAVGLYRIASRLLTSVYDIVTQPLVKSAWVRLAEATRAGRDGLAEMRALQSLTILLLGCLLTCLAVAAPDLVPTLLGSQWTDAVAIVPWMALAFLLASFVLFVDPLLSMHEATGALFRLRLLSTAVAIGAALAAARLGLEAVVLARVVAAAASVALLWLGVRRHAGVPATWPMRSFLLGAAGSAVTALVTLWVGTWPLGTHAVTVAQFAGTAAVFAGVGFLCRGQLRPALRPTH